VTNAQRVAAVTDTSYENRLSGVSAR
jgi:hypothetical protein